MWRQTSGWVTCAKPSRQNTDPCASHTFSQRFLKQNYPKCISDVLSKIPEQRTELSDVLSEFVIFLKLGLLWWKWKIHIANHIFNSCQPCEGPSTPFTAPFREAIFLYNFSLPFFLSFFLYQLQHYSIPERVFVKIFLSIFDILTLLELFYSGKSFVLN